MRSRSGRRLARQVRAMRARAAERRERAERATRASGRASVPPSVPLTGTVVGRRARWPRGAIDSPLSLQSQGGSQAGQAWSWRVRPAGQAPVRHLRDEDLPAPSPQWGGEARRR